MNDGKHRTNDRGGVNMGRPWELLIGAVLFLAVVATLWRFGNESLLQVFLSFAVIAPLAYLTIDRLRQQNHLFRMKEEALRAELASLQSQIDPHFFFNTLNNLYGLTVAGSPRAPEMILELSDLMRFTIYEGRKAMVQVDAEIKYLRNYLNLMSIRAKSEKVVIEFETEIAEDAAKVPPLVTVILIENAFKHGPTTIATGARIRIHLRIDARGMVATVKNNFDAAKRKEGQGIGLANLKRRLALRYPAQKHALTLHEEDGWYTATARIDLCTT